MNFLKASWKIIKILLTILILIFFILYFIRNQADFQTVFGTSPAMFLGLFALNSLHFFINGLFILNILKRFGHRIGNLESFYISTISSFANTFIPMQGGAVIRSVYLKKTLNFPYAHFIASLYGNYIVIFEVNALFALVTLIMIHLRIATVPLPLFAFFGLLLIAMLVLALVRVREGIFFLTSDVLGVSGEGIMQLALAGSGGHGADAVLLVPCPVGVEIGFH